MPEITAVDPNNIVAPTNLASTISISLGNKPFATPFYSIGREVCQNMFLENASTPNAKASYYLLKIPGLRRFGSIPSSNIGSCRMLQTASNQRVFMVCGSQFLEVYETGATVLRGTLNTSTGIVNCADNGNLLMLVDGLDGWIFDYALNDFTRITDQDFPGVETGTLCPTHVTMLDSYFIINVPGTNKYRWSNSFYKRDINDAGDQEPYSPTETTGYWPQLNFNLKVGYPDNIVGLTMCNNYLWLIGQSTSEVHYDTGNYSAGVFQRYQGAIINIGSTSPNSIAKYANNIFWLGRDNAGTLGVFTNNDMQISRISTRGIEQMIESMTDWGNCIAWCYAQSGHAFYVMQFINAGKTFVYDLLTSSWHERTHLVQATGQDARWDGCLATEAWDTLITGDIASPALYSLDPSYYQNDNPMDTGVNYIRCRKTTPIQFQNGVNVIYYWFQVICNQGSGNAVDTPQGVGIDPKVQVAWADDTGIVFHNERSARIGKQGDYAFRSRVLGCGSGRNRCVRITMTDPVPFILVGLLANAKPCRF